MKGEGNAAAPADGEKGLDAVSPRRGGAGSPVGESEDQRPNIAVYGRVALAFLHIAFNRGIRGTYAVFYVALLQGFGWSRAETAGALSVSILLEGLSLPAVGALVDRWGARHTLIAGGLVLSIGLAMSSTISSVWQLYFWVGLVTALGLGLMGMVPHVAIISREFKRNRGTALGIAWAGGGLGMMLLVPLSQVLIDGWGWRFAYVGMGLLAAVFIIPPAAFFFPGGRVEQKKPPAPAADRAEWTVSRALGSTVFWLLFSSRVVASMGNQVITTHQVAHAVDVGFTPIFAASIFGLMGIFSIFGRISFGHLTDRMKLETVFTMVQGISSLGILALMATRDTSYPLLLYVYALCYGLGQGSRALVLSAVSADLFLGRDFGAIYGYFTLSIGVGGALGAWLGGFLYDRTGDYTLAFGIALVEFVVSILMVWCVRLYGAPANAHR